MEKRTVLSSHADWNNHTAFVKNQGIEELKIFKSLKDNGIELKDEELSDEELCMLLNHLCTDGIIENVFSIENHFNRDQATINPAKRNVEARWRTKGFTIVTHSDWSPSFSDNSANVVNARNYLTILLENTKRKEIEYNNLSDDYDELVEKANVFKTNFEQQKLNMKKELLEEQNTIRENLNNELSELKLTIKENAQKIKNQNWYIEQTKFSEQNYNEMKEKLDKVIERYNNGKRICEEQEENAKNNWPDELKNLEKSIDKLKHEYSELEQEYNLLLKNKEELNDECRKAENSLNAFKNQFGEYESIIDSILQKYE